MLRIFLELPEYSRRNPGQDLSHRGPSKLDQLTDFPKQIILYERVDRASPLRGRAGDCKAVARPELLVRDLLGLDTDLNRVL